MLTNARLTAFLATTDPGRAKSFYREILGLRLVAEDDFALVFETASVQLRIQKVERFTPHPFTALGWQVSDIRAAMDQLAGHGVQPERYPFLEQDDRGIWQAPGGTLVAWFKDPDNQLLSFSEPPATSQTGSRPNPGGRP